jgi:methanogenic corrinoid protein MtbC1
MADRQNTDATAKAASLAGPVNLTLVPQSDRRLDPAIMAGMRKAALSTDRGDCPAILRHALHHGIARDDIADFYIPELARELGHDWCTDQMSFAQVTIGASRLQGMLRDLGPEWAGDQLASPSAPSILLVVGQDVHHTLGAMVLSGQLRRRGLSVRLMLGVPLREMAENVSKSAYDAVFISSSLGETLESLRRIVNVIRSSTKKSVPIVIGGTVLEAETKYNVTALTGADYATSVPSEALELCGLKIKYLTIAPQQRGA